MQDRTHLIQITTGSVDEAPRIFSEARKEGTPIVVVVDPPVCCCVPKLDIPSGVITLGQVWGAHDGVLDPGMKCCWCKHRRIAVVGPAAVGKSSIVMRYIKGYSKGK